MVEDRFDSSGMQYQFVATHLRRLDVVEYPERSRSFGGKVRRGRKEQCPSVRSGEPIWPREFENGHCKSEPDDSVKNDPAAT